MGIGPSLLATVLACCLTLAGTANAVTVSGLYTVDVSVESSNQDDLQEGYARGLQEVMVRVSGSRDVLDLEGVDDLLERAESFLQSYEVTREDGGNRLQMTFGAVGVNRAMASVEAPVWGANRPLTLAWVAVEDRGSRHLLTSTPTGETADSWLGSFRSAATERGLPVAFPPRRFADDRELLSDLWGQFNNRIVRASDGQAHDALALVRIRRDGSGWRASWTIEGPAVEREEMSVTADSQWRLAEAVINHWTEGYASRYAVDASDVDESPKVDLVLEGVSTLADYGGVVKALKSFTPVTYVAARRVRGDRLTIQVSFDGELDQLKQYVALDPRFVSVEQPPSRVSAEGGAGPENGSGAANTSGTASSGQDGIGDALAYQPLVAGDEQDAEQAFESLYPVLYYRWQPAGPVESDSDG
ncbi:hypothetical protein SAMN05216429_11438 [Marinobacter persicus]|uniref:DUF2066 domain-containing protein n=1 Tax=Marinobacter persicus TaxID=930118 RepID=A0A1I3Y6B6_9GAMM|nr:DUF2066 domain-containing protein [Marinobacter persicus]GHD53096.1 hypothetical protein GCM10008110_26600 [Marinobacter persicus]SFK27240.1 hypothetical protein SAMN05216429_11438 [Marinobacter persicus]